ncbi:MAG: tRNA uridine-5-carboxymethylaminomethyl(34) synthesis enzyme MnmG [Candidatus Omnitrophota bacterium]|jgi:tRNA uridine 5-carboxymethylaminomethyl modification enzyme
MNNEHDVIVVGAGHAGIEAALAVSRMGCSCLMLTMDVENIGLMSCNPALGGVGKGQLVREIDALGGEMGKAADACAIQFRVLNASKGPAVQSSRAQIDKEEYRRYMCAAVAKQERLEVRALEAADVLIESGKCRGIRSVSGEELPAKAVILCPGTFTEGLIHIGLRSFPGGRINEPASVGLVASLRSAGLKMLRFKTGTCPRIKRSTIDYSSLTAQEGDVEPRPFSFSSSLFTRRQFPCYITHTNSDTHRIIRDNLDRSPLYTGLIHATGVRYCPSIEDKIVKFSSKERHQVFLEPEGRDSEEIYPNGLSTSLPEDAQLLMLHSVKGLEKARMIRPGYGIEHTVVEPTQLYPTLEAKDIPGLYLAGQINGTTGYEEAGSQGLLAGINAALKVRREPVFILDRSSSYIGVLVDDLTTKGTPEPYRMFTSRVEYRLILREDNADIRLSSEGYRLGLVSKEAFLRVEERAEALATGRDRLRRCRINPSAKNQALLKAGGLQPLDKGVSAEDFLKRPGTGFALLEKMGVDTGEIPLSARGLIETEIKYAGFIRRQESEVQRFRNLERIKLPESIDYKCICGLSREISEKLTAFRPVNLGQASRISGVTPASISLMMVYLKKFDAPAVSKPRKTESNKRSIPGE